MDSLNKGVKLPLRSHIWLVHFFICNKCFVVVIFLGSRKKETKVKYSFPFVKIMLNVALMTTKVYLRIANISNLRLSVGSQEEA